MRRAQGIIQAPSLDNDYELIVLFSDYIAWGTRSAKGSEVISTGRLEGIAFEPADQHHAWISINPDDVDKPSRLFELELVGPW